MGKSFSHVFFLGKGFLRFIKYPTELSMIFRIGYSVENIGRNYFTLKIKLLGGIKEIDLGISLG